MDKSYAELAAQITAAAMQPGGQSEADGWIDDVEKVALFYETIYAAIFEADNKKRTSLNN